MVIDSIDPKALNKIVDDATVALNNLYIAIGREGGFEEDYVPQETSLKAYESLQKVWKAVHTDPKILSEVPRRGLFKDVIDKLGPKLDSPSVQTALGTAAVDLMGIFHTIQKIFEKKDVKKVSQSEFDFLDKK